MVLFEVLLMEQLVEGFTHLDVSLDPAATRLVMMYESVALTNHLLKRRHLPCLLLLGMVEASTSALGVRVDFSVVLVNGGADRFPYSGAGVLNPVADLTVSGL